MDRKEIYDSGFTAGYAAGSEGELKLLGSPIELILLQPTMIPDWRAGYEEGYAKGKSDRRALIAWREAQRAETQVREEEQNHER